MYIYIYTYVYIHICMHIYPKGPEVKLCHPFPTKDILCTTNAGHVGHGCVTATGPLCLCFVGLTQCFSSV